MEAYASMPLSQDLYYTYVPQYYEYHCIERDPYDDTPMANHFLFDFYVRKALKPEEQDTPTPKVLVKRAAKHLSGYVTHSSPEIYPNLCNIYNVFHLDEEV